MAYLAGISLVHLERADGGVGFSFIREKNIKAQKKMHFFISEMIVLPN